MKIRENKVAYIGRDVLWFLPALLISGCKYAESVRTDYERWFQIELIWLFWEWRFWGEYKKVKNDRGDKK